jgi:MOSC domain-containing protein YiiM
MRDPAMRSLLVAHHRPGFYLRVLHEGTVQAGDEITRIKAGEEQLFVAEIDGLLYLPNRRRRRGRPTSPAPTRRACSQPIADVTLEL